MHGYARERKKSDTKCLAGHVEKRKTCNSSFFQAGRFWHALPEIYQFLNHDLGGWVGGWIVGGGSGGWACGLSVVVGG